MRSDLPLGNLVAQCIHAAGESSLPGGVPSGTYAVALAVPDEQHLLKTAKRLQRRGIPFVLIREPDPPYHNEAMAIGVYPSKDRKPIKRALSRLPLLKEGKRNDNNDCKCTNR